MRSVLVALVTSIAFVFRSRLALQVEVLALRHQLGVYQRAGRRPRLRPADRVLWAWLSRAWSGWRGALVFVRPGTVISWQRRRFRDHWTRLSRQGKPGRPPVAKEIRDLIRQISGANPAWGSPRIVGELQKLGIEVAKSTVEKLHGPSTQAAVANVAGVPGQPRQGPHLHRLLHRPDVALRTEDSSWP